MVKVFGEYLILLLQIIFCFCDYVWGTWNCWLFAWSSCKENADTWDFRL